MKMVRFGKYQRFTSNKLKGSPLLAKLYFCIVGYPRIGGFLRSVWFRRTIKRHRVCPRFLLDAGCGMGEYSFYVAELFPQAKVLGVDLDYKRIEECIDIKNRFKIENVDFRCMDLLVEAWNEEFDFVYCIDVLEHIRETKDVLKMFYKALKANGYLYIRVPNNEQKRIFKGSHFERFHEWSKHEHIGQHYDYSLLRDELVQIGFSIVESRQTNHFFAEIAFELELIFENINEYLLAGMIPILKCIGFLDTLLPYRQVSKGNGLLFLCRK